ncbi:histidine kinase [Ichthyenterobacterium magnum]|uniref:GAF domain-containing protein n=1 Tax=Ichthyenterobacterium magnum TaxID=1230530 RepID=A0A420DGS0_9FLAO|nr:histidine kinase [Ichthyenterobacterium magnum]RKE92283.1 GAF domain-containing protein [Ichthyenterobacterium magnum]
MQQSIPHTAFNNEEFENTLIYFSKSLLGKDSEDDILWDLAQNCIAKLGFEDCVIYLINHKTNSLIQKAAFGPKNKKNEHIYKPVSVKLGEGISGYVAQSGVAEIVNNTSEDSRYIVDDAIRLSEIAVPISSSDYIYGVIDCEHPHKNYFTKQHLRILSAVASICAIKIKNIRNQKTVLEKHKKVLQLKEELVDLKLKALSSQLNPHFVFNALNSIQYFITSEQKKLAVVYLSTFSKLIRFHLKYLGKDAVCLKEEINMIHWYLSLQRLRYSNQFTFDINAPANKHFENAKIPSFILQTLLENSVEHSIFNQHKNQTIDIKFLANDDYINIHITYLHDANCPSKTQYTPEYRKSIMDWQDQIKLLNSVKNYDIKKKITFIKKSDKTNGSIVNLKLPNLTSL